jgi:hypothetical protein
MGLTDPEVAIEEVIPRAADDHRVGGVISHIAVFGQRDGFRVVGCGGKCCLLMEFKLNQSTIFSSIQVPIDWSRNVAGGHTHHDRRNHFAPSAH